MKEFPPHSRSPSVIALVLTFGFIASVTVAAEPPKKVTEVEGITEYLYDNGLRLLLFPDSSQPRVTVNITYFVGSRHEGRGETGMAHLLEHMLFKGTDKHREIWKELENHGATFNGTTWVDRTNYYETLPTAEPDNLEWALELEADRMINSLISDEDLSTEFSVVRNEFEMGENNPTGVLLDRMFSSAYLWHNYGKSTIGSKSDIERVPVKNLRAFYEKYYQPDNAMLVIAGDFEKVNVLALVDKHFASIPRPKRVLDYTYTVEPIQDGPRHVELRRVGDVAAAGVIYHICAASHADYAPVEVLRQMLLDEPSGRLYKELVETGMAANVYGAAWPWNEPGVIWTLASVRVDDPLEPVLAGMQRIMEGFGTSEISVKEVERAKNRILKNIEMALKSSQRIAIGFSTWAGGGDWRLFFLHRDRIEQVSVDDVRRVAIHYLKQSNRTSGLFLPTNAPDRTEVPETPNVLALVKRYKGREALSEGEAFEATPDNIESRVKRTIVSNGLKLALLSKETRGDSVRAVLTLHFGSEEAIQGRIDALDLIPTMLMRGTKKRTYEELRDELDRLKATVSFGGGGFFGRNYGSVSANIVTDRPHLPAVIRLVAEMLTEPSFPEKEFEIVKKERLTSMEEQLSNPQTRAVVSLLRRLNPWPTDNVRYVPTVAEGIERLKAVTLEQVRNCHRGFYGANNAEMTVVGDFDDQEISKVIEETLGKWNATKPFTRIATPYRSDIPGSEEVIHTPDKKMAMIGSAINMELRDDDPDYPAMHLANYVFGASAKSRLLNRLRQKEGISYGAGSVFAADSQDHNALFLAYGICAPQNADKAAMSTLDEFNLLVREGIPEVELTEAKDSYAKKSKNQLTNDRFVASYLNRSLHLGRTMEYRKWLASEVESLTPQKVQSVIKKYLNLDRLIRVKAGDLEPESDKQEAGETTGVD